MAGVVAAVITDALRSQAGPGIIDTTFRNDEVMQLFPTRPLTGGATYNRKMQYGSNSSVGRYSEGDSIGVAGSQSYLTAQWPVSYYKVKYQITGHARDQLKSGNPGAVFFNQLELEFTTGMKDLVDFIAQDFLGTGTSAPVGIQGIVDSTGTIAGVARATYAWFAAYEGSNGSTIALVDLDLAERTSRDANYAGNFNEYWTSWKQVQKYKGVVVNAGQANSPIRLNDPTGISLPGVSSPMTIGGRTIRPIRDLTDSIWMGVQTDTLFCGVQRDFTTYAMGRTDDSDQFMTTVAVGLGCDDPRRNWKMTGYTA